MRQQNVLLPSSAFFRQMNDALESYEARTQASLPTCNLMKRTFNLSSPCPVQCRGEAAGRAFRPSTPGAGLQEDRPRAVAGEAICPDQFACAASAPCTPAQVFPNKHTVARLHP